MNERVRIHFDWMDQFAPWERHHAERVAVYATSTAFRLGYRGEDLVCIRVAAEAHDIGKIAGDELGVLESSWRTHPVTGEEILFDFVPMVRKAVRHHHERLDGSGYPDGLRGLDIPGPAQIIGAAEYFDVAYHGSPFSTARSLEVVQSELRSKAGIWFDGEVIEALLEVQRVIQPVGT